MERKVRIEILGDDAVQVLEEDASGWRITPIDRVSPAAPAIGANHVDTPLRETNSDRIEPTCVTDDPMQDHDGRHGRGSAPDPNLERIAPRSDHRLLCGSR
jgi:hypothetical protein